MLLLLFLFFFDFNALDTSDTQRSVEKPLEGKIVCARLNRIAFSLPSPLLILLEKGFVRELIANIDLVLNFILSYTTVLSFVILITHDLVVFFRVILNLFVFIAFLVFNCFLQQFLKVRLNFLWHPAHGCNTMGCQLANFSLQDFHRSLVSHLASLTAMSVHLVYYVRVDHERHFGLVFSLQI